MNARVTKDGVSIFGSDQDGGDVDVTLSRLRLKGESECNFRSRMTEAVSMLYPSVEVIGGVSDVINGEMIQWLPSRRGELGTLKLKGKRVSTRIVKRVPNDVCLNQIIRIGFEVLCPVSSIQAVEFEDRVIRVALMQMMVETWAVSYGQMGDVMRRLRRLHNAGLQHKDVHPMNIMQDMPGTSGRVMLIDWFRIFDGERDRNGSYSGVATLEDVPSAWSERLALIRAIAVVNENDPTMRGCDFHILPPPESSSTGMDTKVVFGAGTSRKQGVMSITNKMTARQTSNVCKVVESWFIM